jgi:hyperosmotically inducible protein
MKSFISNVAVAALSLVSLTVYAQAAPDNSKTNSTTAAMSAPADKQKNDATDLNLTRQIRRSLMADKTLSTYAHNVKIVAVNGTVTLNGPVRSADEKASVQAKAVAIAGNTNVVDQLTVTPPRS